jgi:hypothetical protein
MDELSPVEHHAKGLEYLAEAEVALRRFGPGTHAVPGYAALATAHFAASQSAMLGVMASEEAGTLEAVDGDAVEKIGNDWGVALGLLVTPEPEPQPSPDQLKYEVEMMSHDELRDRA